MIRRVRRFFAQAASGTVLGSERLDGIATGICIAVTAISLALAIGYVLAVATRG